MAGLARRRALTVGAPFEPGGECAWVAPAVSASDGDVVLKVGWTHDEARDEAAGLRDPRGFARRMAELTGVDGDRVIAWLFARCVVEAAWWPDDLVPIATALRP